MATLRITLKQVVERSAFLDTLPRDDSGKTWLAEWTSTRWRGPRSPAWPFTIRWFIGWEAPWPPGFQQSIRLEEARQLFPQRRGGRAGHSLEIVVERFCRRAAGGRHLALIAGRRHDLIGYRGPSDALIGLDLGGRVVGVLLNDSFDNDDYVAAVREDEYFRNSVQRPHHSTSWPNWIWPPSRWRVFPGATMTSLTVAEGLVRAADDFLVERRAASAQHQHRTLPGGSAHWSAHDIGVRGGLAGGRS